MASTVKVKNPKTGITYVYSSESYWDKDLKQPRNHRKLIGKLNEKGELVPTGKRGRPKTSSSEKDADEQTAALQAEVEDYSGRCRELEEENGKLKKEISVLREEKKKAGEQLEKLLKEIYR